MISLRLVVLIFLQLCYFRGENDNEKYDQISKINNIKQFFIIKDEKINPTFFNCRPISVFKAPVDVFFFIISKPFSDRTGPEKVVFAILIFLLEYLKCSP